MAAAVTTIEGLAPEGGLHPIQQAFWENHGLQCGFCTPGMIMCAADLLARDPDPDDADRAPRHRGQLLPLHRLPQHRQGDPGGRGGHARRGHRRADAPAAQG